jgi:hypothetical protein
LAGSYSDKLELMLELRFAVGRMLEKEKDLSWSALKPRRIAKLDSVEGLLFSRAIRDRTLTTTRAIDRRKRDIGLEKTLLMRTIDQKESRLNSHCV